MTNLNMKFAKDSRIIFNVKVNFGVKIPSVKFRKKWKNVSIKP